MTESIENSVSASKYDWRNAPGTLPAPNCLLFEDPHSTAALEC